MNSKEQKMTSRRTSFALARCHIIGALGEPGAMRREILAALQSEGVASRELARQETRSWR
jgi:hypothetical protein